MKQSIVLLFVLSCVFAISAQENVVVFYDNFSSLRRGPLSVAIGAHTEYHYLNEAAPKVNWAVSAFTWDPAFQRAWSVRQEREDRYILQNYENSRTIHAHPMLVAGDGFWRDYMLEVEITPLGKERRMGVVFRYHNDRCYYFAGVHGRQAILKLVKHATAFRKPYEKILARDTIAYETGEKLKISINVSGEKISANIGDVALKAEDATFKQGKIGLCADTPAKFHSVSVEMTTSAREKYEKDKSKFEETEARLQAANPSSVLWKKISTEGFGVGRNLRFGDLNNDGQIDVLIGQVLHHGPKDRHSELSCLTAMTFDGDLLWQIGVPDPWKSHLTNDVGFQILDFDGDGRTDVVYCKDFEIIVAEGATGETKFKTATPRHPQFTSDYQGNGYRYERILGDCLFFCDLDGAGRDGNLIIKDRYRYVWAYDSHLELMWHDSCKTGHYPFAYDVDDDGRDEIAIGYSLFDHGGRKIWSLDDKIEDHADGVAVVVLNPERGPVIFNAASDEGMLFYDLEGHIYRHHYLGHVQNPAAANFRDDLPGLEIVSINFWGNQGIVHFYDSAGDIYHDFEPNQYGSMCLPVNWTGGSEEFFLHNPNVDEGGMYDGWGRKVVIFPDDGHPDMCNAVLDITGDCRDEIVVWNPHALWVYTQADNPKTGRLYKPKRNPLYNYSNYQATVSLPGWSE
ncbi:hypothetical protein JW935_05865 [candidate division KSB1 bacterium]|nr:hypothetical protein [candidate division KSB1 bacterium]